MDVHSEWSSSCSDDGVSMLFVLLIFWQGNRTPKLFSEKIDEGFFLKFDKWRVEWQKHVVPHGYHSVVSVMQTLLQAKNHRPTVVSSIFWFVLWSVWFIIARKCNNTHPPIHNVSQTQVVPFDLSFELHNHNQE